MNPYPIIELLEDIPSVILKEKNQNFLVPIFKVEPWEASKSMEHVDGFGSGQHAGSLLDMKYQLDLTPFGVEASSENVTQLPCY